MRIISAENIEKVMPTSLWVDAMEKALLAAEKEEYFTPNRMHVDVQKNTLLLMPSVGPDAFATKLVSVFPENAQKQQAVIQGTVILNDGDTGEAIALLNGSKLTAMRTAAVATVGIRFLTDQSIDSLGLIGGGFQGRHIAWMACEERNINRVYLNDFSEEVFDDFKVFLNERKPHIEVVFCKDVRELVSQTSLVITASSSQEPVLPNEPELLQGKCFIGVGSYKPDMREFPESLFQLVDDIWIDAAHGKQESGDLIDPVKQNWIASSQIRLMSDLIGKCKLTKGTRLYKTVGQGIFDLFAAQLVYDYCKKENLGIDIEL